MSVAIGTVNGKICTIVRKPFDSEWVREQLALGMPVWAGYNDGWTIIHGIKGPLFQHIKMLTANGSDKSCFPNIITCLPPLPRKPMPEDARLLYRYMAEGVEPYIIDNFYANEEDVPQGTFGCFFNNKHLHTSLGCLDPISIIDPEIVFAIYNGERVAIALKG